MERVKNFFRCRRVRRTLLRAGSCEASAEELERAQKHLQVCAECRQTQAFLGFMAAAWGEREAPRPGPLLRERTLRAALEVEAKEAPAAKPEFARPALRWGSVAAGLALCIFAAVLLREDGEPPQVIVPEAQGNLEWSNGVEKTLARISEQTAALRAGTVAADRGIDPVGDGLSRVEFAVSDLRFSTREPWSYSVERRLHGVSAAAADLVTNLDSL